MINILEVVTGIFIVGFIVTPIVLSSIVIFRMNRKPGDPVGKVSLEHIAQLEQNDNIIVEDINAALSEIVTRLDAIEEHMEREGQTIKGFASKKGTQQSKD